MVYWTMLCISGLMKKNLKYAWSKSFTLVKSYWIEKSYKVPFNATLLFEKSFDTLPKQNWYGLILSTPLHLKISVSFT